MKILARLFTVIALICTIYSALRWQDEAKILAYAEKKYYYAVAWALLPDKKPGEWSETKWEAIVAHQINEVSRWRKLTIGASPGLALLWITIYWIRHGKVAPKRRIFPKS